MTEQRKFSIVESLQIGTSWQVRTPIFAILKRFANLVGRGAGGREESEICNCLDGS